MDDQAESEKLDASATERLLEMLAEHIDAWRWMSDDEHNGFTEMRAIVSELRLRGDTLVHREDLRLIAAAANHGRQYGPGGDTDYTGFEAALERIETALGGT